MLRMNFFYIEQVTLHYRPSCFKSFIRIIHADKEKEVLFYNFSYAFPFNSVVLFQLNLYPKQISSTPYLKSEAILSAIHRGQSPNPKGNQMQPCPVLLKITQYVCIKLGKCLNTGQFGKIFLHHYQAYPSSIFSKGNYTRA